VCIIQYLNQLIVIHVTLNESDTSGSHDCTDDCLGKIKIIVVVRWSGNGERGKRGERGNEGKGAFEREGKGGEGKGGEGKAERVEWQEGWGKGRGKEWGALIDKEGEQPVTEVCRLVEEASCLIAKLFLIFNKINMNY